MLAEFIAYNFGVLRAKRGLEFLARNSDLAGSCSGDVYILLTGGSLREKNLSWLKGKELIATNLFCLSNQYADLGVKNYSLIEPWQYKKLYFLGIIVDLIGARRKDLIRPIIWLDSTARHYLNNKSLHNDYNSAKILSGMDIRFIKNIGDFLSDGELRIDLSRPCNSAAGTITFSICLAMFLGYKRIYLLGADYSKTPLVTGHLYDNCSEQLSGSDINNIAGFDIDTLITRRAQVIKQYAQDLGVEILNIVDEGYRSKVYDEISYSEIIKLL